MAFTDIGFADARQDKSANQVNTLVGGTSNILFQKATLVIAIVAVDNNQTTDGDEGAVTSIVSNSGLQMTKAVEFCNGQGAAQGGCTVSMWYINLPLSQNIGSDQFTANFSNSASRDASATTVGYFKMGQDCRAVIAGTPITLANDAADLGSMAYGAIPSGHYLWIRGSAVETNATTFSVTDGTWTGLASNTTSGAGAATNIGVRAEYKISTSTTETSNPTATAVDGASVMVAFQELYVRPPQGRERPRVIHLRRRNR